MTHEAAIRELEDRFALRRLRAEYAKAIDRSDWQAYSSLFTEDAVVEYDGLEPLHGRDEILAFGRTHLDSSFDSSMHTAFMPSIEVTGETASGHWYLYVHYGFSDGTTGWVMGEYEDEYRRVDGNWRFTYVTNTNHVDTTGEHIRDS